MDILQTLQHTAIDIAKESFFSECQRISLEVYVLLSEA